MASKKKKRSIKASEPELNIMPFIDVFSVLTTFLLISAAFLSMGIIEVQIPFFTNAPPSKEKPQRSLTINVEVEKTKIILKTEYTAAPVNKDEKEYELNEDGLDQLHRALVTLRQKEPDSDKVTLFSEDDVVYNDLVKVLDAIKNLKPDDPRIKVTDDKVANTERELGQLYKKVVMGSVIL